MLSGDVPLADGWGVEVGLTIDVLVAGLAVIEVPCDITHRVTGNDRAGTMHRASQYKDVLRAITRRKLRRHRVQRSVFEKAAAAQDHFFAYRAVPLPPASDDDVESDEKPRDDADAPEAAVSSGAAWVSVFEVRCPGNSGSMTVWWKSRTPSPWM